MELCTDNAAMIASAARYVPQLRFPHYLNLDVYATGEQAIAPARRPPQASVADVTGAERRPA
jgi:hypothetical protein